MNFINIEIKTLHWFKITEYRKKDKMPQTALKEIKFKNKNENYPIPSRFSQTSQQLLFAFVD